MCVYADTHIYTHARMHAFTHARMHACIHAYMHAQTHNVLAILVIKEIMCMYVCVCVCVRDVIKEIMPVERRLARRQKHACTVTYMHAQSHDVFGNPSYQNKTCM
jgi:hypothetical protein